jgi:hypothetical protein
MWLDIYYGGKRPTSNRLDLMIDEISVSTSGRIGCLDGATNVVGSFESPTDAIATYNPGTGTLVMNRPVGMGFAPLPLTTFTPGDNWSKHLVGDFSGNGRDDIASYHPSNGSWWVSGTRETGFTTARWETFTPGAGWGAHLVGDFTGGGVDEILSYHPSNGTWWLSRPTTLLSPGEREARLEWVNTFRGKGLQRRTPVSQIVDELAEHPLNDTFTTSLWGSYTTTKGWSDHIAGDFNGDGKDDVASFHPGSGSWWVTFSHGDERKTAEWGRFLPGTGWTNHVAGDFNGDGNTDIASFHSGNGTWWVSISDGTKFTTKRWATFNPTNGWGSQLAGDFNGDGIKDIANFHLGNSTWWVGLSTGSSFVTSRWDG